MTIPLTGLGFLSKDGICYSFDHRANGYSRGEGFGILVLKRVSDAIRDGDTIRAVIRGTASNQDGKTPGITQPTKDAQVAAIKQAYSVAGLNPSLTRYFEAHGTGTAIGDPIEASAISEVFTQHRSSEDPLYIGAVKSNIGHLEGAAGIAGLMKAILVLEKGIIPPNIWFEKPNPKIPVSKWNLKFPTTPTAWPRDGLRRASINSFGFGGSNAHLILDDARHFLAMHGYQGNHNTVEIPQLCDKINESEESRKCTSQMQPENSYANGGANGISNGINGTSNGIHSTANSKEMPAEWNRIFLLSSFDEGGIERSATTYRKHLLARVSEIENEDEFLQDFGYTLAERRTRFERHAFVLANSVETLLEALSRPLKVIRASSSPVLALVFTGQGAQWHGMGRELLRFPIFRDSLTSSSKYLKALGCSWFLLG
jgi:acyl transferase domain-containing protein